MTPSSETITFADFRLNRRHRTLLAGNTAVVLHARAFDILELLIDRRAEVVSRDEIIAHVWRGLAVAENNLTVQMSALRRALAAHGGEALILTVPGTGYRFVGEPAADAAPDLPSPPPLRPRLASRRALLLAGSVLLLAGAAAIGLRHSSVPGAPRLSIAVLPFRNLSADVNQDYMADAVTDDLTTDLAQLPGSVVIARESADAYKGRPEKAQIIGRALDVRYLLEGSLRPESGALHVNAQLVDAGSGAHLWAGNFDVAQDKLSGARSEIVRHLAITLDTKLVDFESARSLREHAHDPDAVDLYLRARSVLDRDSTLTGLTAAQALLERAIAAEPDYPQGLAELGVVLMRKISNFDDPDDLRDYARGVAVIDRANDLAPQEPLLLVARGLRARAVYDCPGALPDFQLAISLDPSLLVARDGLADCTGELGHNQEMIDVLQDLLRIDPIDPDNAARQGSIGFSYLMLGNPATALDWLNRADTSIGSTAPQDDESCQESNATSRIAALWQTGMKDEARAAMDQYNRTWPRRSVWRVDELTPLADMALPGHAAFISALQGAGMPAFADEMQDFGVKPVHPTVYQGDFAPTPLSIPGGTRISTPKLHAMLSPPAPGVPRPLILDVGRGGAVIPGANLVWRTYGQTDNLFTAAAGAKNRPIVVMGNGTLGWDSFDAASELIAKGYSAVFWYRGGEEAWAAAGLPAQDKRLE